MTGDLRRDWLSISAQSDEWATPADLERTLNEYGLVIVPSATVDLLRKECATCCLQLLASAFVGTVGEGLVELERGKTDRHVLSLVMGHQQFPLGVCADCGRPAPLREETVLGYAVCAWGCPG